MKNNLKFLYTIMLAAMVGFTSCSDNDDPEPAQQELEVQTAEDIPADPENTGKYTFYSLSNNSLIPSSDSASALWDIGFRGTSVIVNGGSSGPGQGAAQIVEGVFEEIAEAPENGYVHDSSEGLAIRTGSGNGWYTYTSSGVPANAILPIPGRVILLRTAEGKYAKMEIQSYYKGNPDTSTTEFSSLETRPAGKYYSIRYVVQSNGEREF